MSDIERIGVTRRWSDAVIYRGTAYFVEVADDPHQDARGQIGQILAQIDTRLALFGSDRTQLIQVLIYLVDLADGSALNELWDNWVPMGHATSLRSSRTGTWLSSGNGHYRRYKIINGSTS